MGLPIPTPESLRKEACWNTDPHSERIYELWSLNNR